MSEWKEYKLGEVVKFGNGKIRPQSKGNIPVYGGNGILDYSDKYNYTDETIVIGRVGAYCGSVFYENRPIWVSDNALSVKAIPGFDAKFLYYFLSNLKLNEFAEGSSHPLVTQTLLNSIDVIITDNEIEQKKIADVLRSLDDKLDLLNRQNQTLESMAEALFRHYLINEAKEEWKEKSLSQIAIFLNGLACQKFPPKNEIEKLPVLKIKELSNGITDNSDWATTKISSEYLVQNGDVIFAWSASLMVKIWNGGDCILNQHLFKVTSKQYPKWFYYMWSKFHLKEFKSIASSHATTMGHIKRGDLDTAMVLIPSNTELNLMTKQIQPIIEKQILNNKRIITFTKLRDILLPKLMNGDFIIE